MIFVITGPTGCGKTTLANELSHFFHHAPIINADAFQIYKDMDIGTAKLGKDSPYFDHYKLLDFLSPEKSYSIKEYQRDFRNVLNKDDPFTIVVGGSGLYIKAALYDYEFPDEEEETNDFDDASNEELYDRLVKLDPKAAEKIHPNNRKRVMRALSIALNGKTKSEIIESQNHQMVYPEKDVEILFINPPRAELYERINERVDQMIKDGLVEECQKLLKNYQLSITARQAIGYKEIFDYLEGKTSLEEAIELIKKRSRNYAKRQVTFFKHQFKTIEFSSIGEAIIYIEDERNN